MSGINDFAFKMATVNGTGSASANSLLMQAIFRMGIPVTGKNIFPSNIQGLPTFYEIRVSKDGYVARRDDYHVLVAMNKNTQAEDIRNLAPGGICIYPEEWKLKDAIGALNGQRMGGRVLTVNEASPQTPRPDGRTQRPAAL